MVEMLLLQLRKAAHEFVSRHGSFRSLGVAADHWIGGNPSIRPTFRKPKSIGYWMEAELECYFQSEFAMAPRQEEDAPGTWIKVVKKLRSDLDLRMRIIPVAGKSISVVYTL
jgi:hypothetical protein